MSRFRAKDSDFYDFEYFLSLEYRYFSRAHRSRVRNLLQFVGDVKGKKVLDLGGGGGFFAHMLSKRGADVCLADFSEAAITFAQSRFPGLKTVQISGYELETLGEQYDLVVCFDVIEHLDKPKDILDAVKNVLVSGGRFYIATDNAHSPFDTVRFLHLLGRIGSHLSGEGRDYNMIKRVENYRRHVLGINYHASHVNCYGFEELRKEVESLGWQVLRFRTYHLYEDPLKKVLTRFLGPKSGTHMVLECLLAEAQPNESRGAD